MTEETTGRNVLDAMVSFYANQDEFQAAVEVRIEAPGMPPDRGGSMVHDLAVRRPDKVALRQASGTPVGTFVVDGKQHYTAMDPMKCYAWWRFSYDCPLPRGP